MLMSRSQQPPSSSELSNNIRMPVGVKVVLTLMVMPVDEN